MRVAVAGGRARARRPGAPPTRTLRRPWPSRRPPAAGTAGRSRTRRAAAGDAELPAGTAPTARPGSAMDAVKAPPARPDRRAAGARRHQVGRKRRTLPVGATGQGHTPLPVAAALTRAASAASGAGVGRPAAPARPARSPASRPAGTSGRRVPLGEPPQARSMIPSIRRAAPARSCRSITAIAPRAAAHASEGCRRRWPPSPPEWTGVHHIGPPGGRRASAGPPAIPFRVVPGRGRRLVLGRRTSRRSGETALHLVGDERTPWAMCTRRPARARNPVRDDEPASPGSAR